MQFDEGMILLSAAGLFVTLVAGVMGWRVAVLKRANNNLMLRLMEAESQRDLSSGRTSVGPDPLPTEDQRRALCALIGDVFVDLRGLPGKQANDLAYAFHNLPREMYGHGKWSISVTRGALQHYQNTHPRYVGTDYVARFNEIFGAQTPA